MAQSGAANDPQFAGSSRSREKSVLFVHTLNCVESARTPRWTVGAR